MAAAIGGIRALKAFPAPRSSITIASGNTETKSVRPALFNDAFDGNDACRKECLGSALTMVKGPDSIDNTTYAAPLLGHLLSCRVASHLQRPLKTASCLTMICRILSTFAVR
jgi:hypothetical protein